MGLVKVIKLKNTIKLEWLIIIIACKTNLKDKSKTFNYITLSQLLTKIKIKPKDIIKLELLIIAIPYRANNKRKEIKNFVNQKLRGLLNFYKEKKSFYKT